MVCGHLLRPSPFPHVLLITSAIPLTFGLTVYPAVIVVAVKMLDYLEVNKVGLNEVFEQIQLDSGTRIPMEQNPRNVLGTAILNMTTLPIILQPIS